MELSVVPGRPRPLAQRQSAGVLLNVSPDHLDRHGTMERYAAIKERLVAGADTCRSIGVDDAWSAAAAERRAGSGRPMKAISASAMGTEGVFADGSTLVVVDKSEASAIADLGGIGSLRGTHNAQNAAAAVAAALALGVPDETIRSGLWTFPGLPHRLEEVGRLRATLFINDSKATNADSAEKALLSFDHVLWKQDHEQLSL